MHRDMALTDQPLSDGADSPSADCSPDNDSSVSSRANVAEGAIIDLDGTILDSLPYWKTLGAKYLESKGKIPEPGLQERLDSMEMDEAADYLKTVYGLSEDVLTIRNELLAEIRHVYTDDAPLLPHSRELLRTLHERGVRIALFTAAESTAAEAALSRTGIRQFFDCVISTVGTGLDKSKPEAYIYALERLGTPLQSTTVYEDAPYAVAGARLTGMNVITPDMI